MNLLSLKWLHLTIIYDKCHIWFEFRFIPSHDFILFYFIFFFLVLLSCYFISVYIITVALRREYGSIVSHWNSRFPCGPAWQRWSLIGRARELTTSRRRVSHTHKGWHRLPNPPFSASFAYIPFALRWIYSARKNEQRGLGLPSKPLTHTPSLFIARWCLSLVVSTNFLELRRKHNIHNRNIRYE